MSSERDSRPSSPGTSSSPTIVPIDRDHPSRKVEAALGYTFRDFTLLLQALTHRSFTHERREVAPDHNETFEFLGDSVVGLAAANALRLRFPKAREGELTRRRADLVCERTLSKVAETLSMGPALRLGRGEERSGGRTKSRLLASALEASIAAVLLDADVLTALDVATRLLEPHIEETMPGADDYKSRVQELMQVDGGAAPRYELVGHDGPEHSRTFHVAIIGDAGELARGSGRSKSEAEQAAARRAWAILRGTEEPSGETTRPSSPSSDGRTSSPGDGRASSPGSTGSPSGSRGT